MLFISLSSLSVTHSHILILTDNLSVSRALETWSFQSTKIILQLLNTIYKLNKSGISVQLVWCPDHKGIPPNEAVDQMAKFGLFTRTLCWISPDDILRHERSMWMAESIYEWINSYYTNSFSHLHSERHFSRWVTSRSLDVTLDRWRSRTVITCRKLYRLQLTYSPICNFCFEMDTPDHILLHCPHLNGPRQTFFPHLALQPSITYRAILDASFASPMNLEHFIKFSRLALPHQH